MNKALKVELSTKEEVLIAKELYSTRAKWLKDKGIEQWRRSEQIHSIEYLLAQQKLNQFYVCKLNEVIIGAFSLQEEDMFWKDNESSLYLHAFVSSIEHNGYGNYMIEEMKKVCKQKDKKISKARL